MLKRTTEELIFDLNNELAFYFKVKDKLKEDGWEVTEHGTTAAVAKRIDIENADDIGERLKNDNELVSKD